MLSTKKRYMKAQIPTYAIRAYMYDVVEKSKKGKKRIMGTKKTPNRQS